MKNQKFAQFVVKLIKLTRSNDITWNSFAPKDEELLSGEIVLDKIYETSINFKSFRLYRYKLKLYIDEYNFEWDQRIRLELLDAFGNTDYEFDYDNSLDDLYEIVREQTSNVINIIDDILGVKLEIIEAKYYTSQKFVDVTLHLQNRVSNNRLIIDAANIIAGDPDPGVPKKLKVKYSISGEILEKEVNEGDTLVIP